MTVTARHARDRRAPLIPSPRTAAGRANPDARPAVRPLDPADLHWMQECRRHLHGPGADLDDLGQLSAVFDTYAAAWHATDPALRWDPRPTTTAAAIAVGDLVIRGAAGAHWVAVVDTRVLALAHPSTTALELPFQAVTAAWAAGRPGALPELVEELVGRTLRRAGALHEPARLSGALRLLSLRR
ncbi:hypothetical protein QUV83_01910 [Cellulomonas cellasea]|uniref:hypothetical protein n=1 Tax=Cellulomonas cellasea TaxID=43670 RepID=UPI0025A40AC5|nr:hypothetical protein [Cellulomonas cellasea]MDM8083521.1 hypothetical protein [Cellulomonas cellasea]